MREIAVAGMGLLEFTEGAIDNFFRRSEAAKNAGGLSAFELFDQEAPLGWWYDVYTAYWLPPNVALI